MAMRAGFLGEVSWRMGQSRCCFHREGKGLPGKGRVLSLWGCSRLPVEGLRYWAEMDPVGLECHGRFLSSELCQLVTLIIAERQPTATCSTEAVQQVRAKPGLVVFPGLGDSGRP